MRGDSFRDLIGRLFAVVVGLVVGAAFLLFWLLLLYEIAAVIFHYAFGIELPGPFDLMLPTKA